MIDNMEAHISNILSKIGGNLGIVEIRKWQGDAKRELGSLQNSKLISMRERDVVRRGNWNKE